MVMTGFMDSNLVIILLQKVVFIKSVSSQSAFQYLMSCKDHFLWTEGQFYFGYYQCNFSLESRNIQHSLIYSFQAEYKKGQGVMNKEPAVIGRPDFEHAVEASKLSSQVRVQ